MDATWSTHQALMVDKAYEQLMVHRRVGNGEAGKARHHATAKLREKVGKTGPEHLVAYTHIRS